MEENEIDKLSFEEFRSYFFSYIPLEKLSDKFYDDNVSFCDKFILDCWQQYTKYQLVDITVFCALAESFFENIFIFKPVLDNTDYKD